MLRRAIVVDAPVSSLRTWTEKPLFASAGSVDAATAHAIVPAICIGLSAPRSAHSPSASRRSSLLCPCPNRRAHSFHHVDLGLAADGAMAVEETVRYDFGANDRHGILPGHLDQDGLCRHRYSASSIHTHRGRLP